MDEITLSGIIVYGGDFEEREGHVVIEEGRIKEIEASKNVEAIAKGIIIPSFINSHTHIGDSVAKEMDFIDLEKLVGSGGLKERILKETPPEKLVDSMKNTTSGIIAAGMQMFADFREGGVVGIKMLKEALKYENAEKRIKAVIFGRPEKKKSAEDIERLFEEVDGIGMSSTADYDDLKFLKFLMAEAKNRNKMFAIHAGERNREDIKDAIELEPDFIVHLTKASPKDFKEMFDKSINVVVCVRSNLVTKSGLPPLREMLASGLTVGVGTDNVMLNSPNIFSEMEFISKIFNIEEKEVLKMCTLNGAKILKEEREIGTIEEGKKANILVIKDDSLNMKNVRKPIKGVVRRATRDDIKAMIYEGEMVISQNFVIPTIY